ncbi:MAG: ASKHA domain-containing protein [Lachnospiraceae bacterium]|nr:ASKHA domain-containing protein [Lachnospiraceae bacterium]
MKLTEFDIRISKENVCRLIQANPDSSMYQEIMAELQEMLPAAYEKLEPTALLEFGDFEAYADMIEEEGIEEALYGIITVGEEIGSWSTQLFREGNYLGGMLADAIADDCLYQMDEAISEAAIGMCRERQRGIVRRLEAPVDIPMSIQKKAYDITDAGRQAGIEIKGSYMYSPVKTVCQVYILDKDTTRYHAEHDCGRCENATCKMRNISVVTITVKSGKGEQKIRGRKKDTLLESLRANNLFLPAVCAGRGVCGKCRVRVLKGEVPATETDLRFFSQQEIEEGYRLACRSYPESDCTILTQDGEAEGFYVEAPEKDAESLLPDTEKAYGIAADIGTTTVAMQLVELQTGKTADVYTTVNRQRAYGADVISRIEAAGRGGKEAMTGIIREILQEGIEALSVNGTILIRQMVIGGNTTMIHLLMGYFCETLGVYPFRPVNIETIHTTDKELFGKQEKHLDVTVCPGISTFVGGDIVAGLYALDFQKREKVCVLIDLGTNGELAIGNKERILTTSTAAGPAFEGGNILCGMGSVPGAICKVEIREGKAQIRTIGDAKARGICGTGVIDCVYELVGEGIVDETGLMEEPYFETGFPLSEDGQIRFCQKDVREFQLAKSAVRAGLETLILRYGISWEEIDKVYVAGGFGHKMDIHKAVGIGLFPAFCEEKVEAVGNTCLQGAVKYLTQKDASEAVERLVEVSEEIGLSGDKNFQEFYMENMYFL